MCLQMFIISVRCTVLYTERGMKMHKEYRTYLGLNFTKKFRSFCNFQQGRESSRLEIFMFNKKYICYFTRLFNILNQVLICIEQKKWHASVWWPFTTYLPTQYTEWKKKIIFFLKYSWWYCTIGIHNNK